MKMSACKHFEIVIFYVVFTRFTFSVDEELRVVRDKIVQDYNELPIRDLCIRTSGKYNIKYFNLDGKFEAMVAIISELRNSRIFKVFWNEFGEKIEDNEVTMEIIFSQMWLGICEELQAICKQFSDGDVQLSKIEEYLDVCKGDYDALVNEFTLLSKYCIDKECLDRGLDDRKLNQIRRNFVDMMKKVKRYKSFYHA